MTDYELGLVKLIPMPIHLLLDGLGGALLAASPWLFNFDEVVWTPHVVIGLLEIGAAVLTQTHPAQAHVGDHTRGTPGSPTAAR
jgi:hypothetical protein